MIYPSDHTGTTINCQWSPVNHITNLLPRVVFVHLANILLKDEESARDNRKTIKARYQRSTKLQTNARQMKITCYT